MMMALEGSYRELSTPELRRELEEVATAWKSVIDVTQISDPDSRVLGEILRLNQSRRRAGLPPLILVASRPSDAVWKIFDILGIAMECRFSGLGAWSND
jgi:hypothetical protein